MALSAEAGAAAVAFAIVLGVTPGRAVAQGKDAAPADADAGKTAAPPDGVEAHPEGEYGGVVPGQPRPDAKPPAAGKRGRLLVTWIGFQPQEGGRSRLFIQLTSDADHELAVVEGALQLTITGARPGAPNLGRHLNTTFFDVAVASVTARTVRHRRARRGRPAQKAGVEIRIQLKNPADLQAMPVRSAREADGLTYFYLDFPPASPPPEATPAAKTPAAK
jgi:hypothetical protein